VIQLWEDAVIPINPKFSTSAPIFQQTQGNDTFRSVALRQEGARRFRNVSLTHQALADEQCADTDLSQA